jgi:hypothetical protein
MKIRIETSIYRDLKKIARSAVNAEIDRVVSVVKEAVTPKEIPELKKLKGYKISIA